MIAYPIMATHAMFVLDSCVSTEISRRTIANAVAAYDG